MSILLETFLGNPTLNLYGALAVTYATAASIAHEEGHTALARCYSASAFLHGLLCLSYMAH